MINEPKDLEIALNYGQGTGSAQMLRFVTEHTEVSQEMRSLQEGA